MTYTQWIDRHEDTIFTWAEESSWGGSFDTNRVWDWLEQQAKEQNVILVDDGLNIDEYLYEFYNVCEKRLS